MNYGQARFDPKTGTAVVRTTNPLDALRFAQQNNANVMSMGKACDGCQAEIPVSSIAFACSSCKTEFDLCNNCNKDKKNTLCPKGWGCDDGTKNRLN